MAKGVSRALYATKGITTARRGEGMKLWHTKDLEGDLLDHIVNEHVQKKDQASIIEDVLSANLNFTFMFQNFY